MSPIDRDLVEEERAEAQRQNAAMRAQPGRRPGMDDGTRRLALIAGGIGALLVVTVGGWSLLGHHQPAGIPVIEPLPGPIRVRPVDPGGMQVMSAQVAQTNGPAAQALAPGPETAEPQALQAEVDAARQADAPKRATPAVTAIHAAPAVPATSPGPVAPPGAVVAVPAAPVAAQPPPATTPVAPVVSTPLMPAATNDDKAPADAVPGSVNHAVQLAALDSDAAAHTEWIRLSKLSHGLFDHRTPSILRVSHGDKVFYRLRTGGFASRASAEAFCGQLKARGIACTPADF